MKIRLKQQELDEFFSEAMDRMEVCPCGEIVSEALTATDKSDIKSMIKQEIKDFLEMNRSSDFEKRVEKIIKNKFKNDKDIEKHLVDVTKNVLVQLYKTLWTRRSFWANDLKNSST